MQCTITPVVKREENRFEGLTPSELNDKEKQFLVKLALAILGERHRPGQGLVQPG